MAQHLIKNNYDAEGCDQENICDWEHFIRLIFVLFLLCEIDFFLLVGGKEIPGASLELTLLYALQSPGKIKCPYILA